MKTPLKRAVREDAGGGLPFLPSLAKLPALLLLAAVSAPLLESTTDMMKLERERRYLLPPWDGPLHTAEELLEQKPTHSLLCPQRGPSPGEKGVDKSVES